MIAFDTVHAAVHYHPDRRFEESQARPQCLDTLALPRRGSVNLAWLKRRCFGAPKLPQEQ